MRTFVTVLRWEMHKLYRRPSSYVGFVLCLAFCVAIMVGFGYSQFRGLRRWSEGMPFDPVQLINGPFFANFVLELAGYALMPLFAATVAGSQLSGEARDGTLRALLVRPPSRSTVYLAKLVATWIWLQLIIFFLLALALLVGHIAYGGGPLMVFIWEFRRAGPWLVESGDWPAMMLTVSLGCGASMLLLASGAMMLSAVTETPVVAHVGTLGAFFISSVLQRLPDELITDDFRDLLPTTHLGFWHELYRLWHPDPDAFKGWRIAHDLGWCGTFTVAFLIIGLWRFSRRDITS